MILHQGSGASRCLKRVWEHTRIGNFWKILLFSWKFFLNTQVSWIMKWRIPQIAEENQEGQKIKGHQESPPWASQRVHTPLVPKYFTRRLRFRCKRASPPELPDLLTLANRSDLQTFRTGALATHISGKISRSDPSGLSRLLTRYLRYWQYLCMANVQQVSRWRYSR